jgi:hypothetical protein
MRYGWLPSVRRNDGRPKGDGRRGQRGSEKMTQVATKDHPLGGRAEAEEVDEEKEDEDEEEVEVEVEVEEHLQKGASIDDVCRKNLKGRYLGPHESTVSEEGRKTHLATSGRDAPPRRLNIPLTLARGLVLRPTKQIAKVWKG